MGRVGRQTGGMRRPLSLTAHTFFILHSWPVFQSPRSGLTHADTYRTLRLFPASHRLFKQGQRRPVPGWGWGDVNTPALLFGGQDTLKGRIACPGGMSLEGQVWAVAPRHGYWSPELGPACNRRQDHALESLSAELSTRPWATSQTH